MKINFNVTGAQRKELTYAIGEVIGQVPVYAGMPTAAYHMIGGYTVSKTGEFTAEGSVTDETNAKIIARLEKLGYVGTVEDAGGTEAEATQDTDTEDMAVEETPAAETTTAKPDKTGLPSLYTLDTPRGEIFIAEEFSTHDEAASEGYGEYFSTALGTVYSYTDDSTFALVTSKKAGDWDTTKIKRDFREIAAEVTPDEASGEPTNEDGSFMVEMPLTGFTPEKLDNLTKLVNAKAPLLKAALGIENLPIQQTAETLRFPWFSYTEDAGLVTIYSQFISALCKTAKEKKRVTAKEKEAENPKYAMRCFLLSIGMIGAEYKAARKALLSRLEGNSSWKNGRPEQATENAETESEATNGE